MTSTEGVLMERTLIAVGIILTSVSYGMSYIAEVRFRYGFGIDDFARYMAVSTWMLYFGIAVLFIAAIGGMAILIFSTNHDQEECSQLNVCEHQTHWETICREQSTTDPMVSKKYESYSCMLCYCRYPQRKCEVKK
jgi:hypothetical protein